MQNIDVVILAGGLGSRLKNSIGETQKVLSEIAGRPFLDIIIKKLTASGFNRIILCVGHYKEHVKRHYSNWKDCNMLFSEEHKPLGTGGALKNALHLINSNDFLLLNGDSFININYNDFIGFHFKHNSEFTMALCRLPDTDKRDYGVVSINNKNRITSFNEKIEPNSKNYINAGIYLMNNNIKNFMPMHEVFSLEIDIFPKLININSFGFVWNEELIDIGTPSRLNSARDKLK